MYSYPSNMLKPTIEMSGSFMSSLKDAGKKLSSYPFIGLLPGRCQESVADSYDLNATNITNVSGVVESLGGTALATVGALQGNPVMVDVGAAAIVDGYLRILISDVKNTPMGPIAIEMAAYPVNLIRDKISEYRNNESALALEASNPRDGGGILDV